MFKRIIVLCTNIKADSMHVMFKRDQGILYTCVHPVYYLHPGQYSTGS